MKKNWEKNYWIRTVHKKDKGERLDLMPKNRTVGTIKEWPKANKEKKEAVEKKWDCVGGSEFRGACGGGESWQTKKPARNCHPKGVEGRSAQGDGKKNLGSGREGGQKEKN